MSSEDMRQRTWKEWCAQSRLTAEKRWGAAQALDRPKMAGKKWYHATRSRLARLTEMEVLGARSHVRIVALGGDQLAPADQGRLTQQGIVGRRLYAFAVGFDKEKEKERKETNERLADQFLSLNPGKRLREGKLSLQVFVDENTMLPVGMNIQLRGLDPARGNRPTYLRYDLDVVPMGEAAGPVTHFSAHWHAGEDPDAADAEDHDHRLAALILDPLAVLDILIETFFPNGPADVDAMPVPPLSG